MYTLKQEVNFHDFFKQIQQCSADVYYVTAQNDYLNLKSELSRYLFVSAAASKGILSDGQIRCKDPQDYEKLKEYLEENPCADAERQPI